MRIYAEILSDYPLLPPLSGPLEMVRKLKFHEQKLLKKVDFLQWKNDSTVRELDVMRTFYIQKREDYVK